jgi:hypothetical protein
VPVRQLLCAPSICAGQERWLLYFSLFLDESGKTHQKGYAALCGFVAPMNEWAQLGDIWTSIQLKWGVPALHMSRVMAPVDSVKQDEWTALQKKKGDHWIEWRDAVVNEFADLIGQSNVAAVGAVLDTAAYRAIKNADPENFLITHADCNVFLFQHALMHALDKIEVVDKAGMLSVLIDDDEEHAFDYYKSYWNLQKMITHPELKEEQKRRFERVPNRVDQVAFCKDTFHPALQAADMLAYISRRFKTEKMSNQDEQIFGALYAKLTRGQTHPVQDYLEADLRTIAGNIAKAVRIERDEENDGIRAV